MPARSRGAVVVLPMYGSMSLALAARAILPAARPGLSVHQDVVEDDLVDAVGVDLRGDPVDARQVIRHPDHPVQNLFDLRRVAVVHNLHVIARQPDDGDYQLAA
jgi:hypothetical protein